MTRRLLAIDPGTRYLGFALFEEKELVYHGVLVLRAAEHSTDLLREAEARVRLLIDDFRPAVIAIEAAIPIGTWRSRQIAKLVSAVVRYGDQQGLRSFVFAPSTVKRLVSGNGHASKHAVWRVVVERYPELQPYLIHESDFKARFHGNMLDAVSVGMAFYAGTARCGVSRVVTRS